MGDEKAVWRTRLTAARRDLTPAERTGARAANSRWLLDALDGVGSVAGYLPLPSEPLDRAVLDALAERKVRVLVPITRPDDSLDWAAYPTPTVPGPFGIESPGGPPLGPSAIAEVEVILVPALAVDRRGVRLGRGGGHYDRTLAQRPPGRLIAVLYDGELVDELPADPHDMPVQAAVTPASGLVELG